MTVSKQTSEITLAPALASLTVSLSASGEILATINGTTFAITNMADLRAGLELKVETDRVSAQRNLEQTRSANFARSRKHGADFSAQTHKTQSEFARRVANFRGNTVVSEPIRNLAALI
jgi:hypothetical protein